MARDTVLGNIRSFVGTVLGNLTGRSNLAAWVVAGTAAYFLWIKPERDAQKEREAMALLKAENDKYRYVERRKPLPDPQETGLIKGVKKETKTSSYMCFCLGLAPYNIAYKDVLHYMDLSCFLEKFNVKYGQEEREIIYLMGHTAVYGNMNGRSLMGTGAGLLMW